MLIVSQIRYASVGLLIRRQTSTECFAILVILPLSVQPHSQRIPVVGNPIVVVDLLGRSFKLCKKLPPARKHLLDPRMKRGRMRVHVHMAGVTKTDGVLWMELDSLGTTVNDMRPLKGKGSTAMQALTMPLTPRCRVLLGVTV